MHELLNRNLFFVKEHTGIFKAANNYDILDPDTSQVIMHCREDSLGFFTKLARFSDYKRMTPFDVHIRTPEGTPIVRVSRGISIFLSNVNVMDENNQRIGGFKQKFFSIGGKFTVLGAEDQPMCELKGKWSGWDFRFNSTDGQELAHVTKKWAGAGKELFTSADNYMLEISASVPSNDPIRPLILASVMCIDMVLKE